jgi:signal recognition particle subunit SRP54
MLPSVGPFAGLQQASQNVDQSQFERLEVIINSMTKKERLNADIINGSRRKRIAAGAGVEVQDVNALLRQYSQMSKMFKQFGKGGMMKNMMRGGMAGLAGMGGKQKFGR